MKIDNYLHTNCGMIGDKIDENYNKVFKKYTKHIDIDSDGSVLEIGPGNGYFLMFLKNKFKLKDENISTIDISDSVHNYLKNNKHTKGFNNIHGDTISILEKQDKKYDLIVMKHVLEHMQRDYISDLIPLLIKSLNKGGKILVEVPNTMNYPFGYYMFRGDFSHYTGFNDKSLKEAFLRNSGTDIKINMHNLFLYTINNKNIFTIIYSSIIKIIYWTYTYLNLNILKATGLPIKVITPSILCIVEKI